jgi:glycosyltransferase involved in cell wall biosynthesis
MSIRVLHLIATLGAGGAERQLSLLAPALAEQGLEVAVAFHTLGPNLFRLEHSGVQVFRLPDRGNHDPRILIDIALVMRRFRADIVQTWLPQMDVIGGLVANCLGVKHILSERSSAAAYSSVDWKLKLRRLLGKRAAAIVANSNSGLDYWRRFDCKNKLAMIRNILTPIVMTEPENDLGLKDYRLIVAANRLSAEKNIEVLVSSLDGALKALPHHHAVVFGDGPDRGKAQELVRNARVFDRLHLVGHTDSLYWWLQRADCFVSTSLMEGHPNVPIEAAASGCPLVLSDIPAHREFFPPDSALFASPCDSAQFTELIVAAVLNSERSFIRALNAKKLTVNLTLDRVAGQYRSMYETVLAAKAGNA